MNTERLLSTGKMGPLIAKYAVPGAVGLVFFSLQSIVDGIIVGNMVGADALAGVSLVVPAYTILTAVAIIIGVGSQAQMSIGMGQGNYVKTKNAFKTGLLSIAVFAALFCLAINLFASPIARFLGAEGDLFTYATDYIRGIMPFVVVAACFYFFDYSLKALGHPRFAMIVMVSSVLLNAGLSIFFVARFGLETFGVGLATGLTSLAGCIMSGVVVFRQMRHNGNLCKKKGHFNWRLLGRIFYNGSSEGVSEIAMGITLFLFNITLLKYVGKEGVAAFSVINYMIFIGTSIFLGISDGTIPVISFNYGAGHWDRIRETVRIVVRTNFIIGTVFLFLLWGCRESIISMFLGGSDNAVASLASEGSKIMGIAFLMNGFNIFSASFFTAIDNAKLSLVIASLRGLVFIVAGITVLPQLFGLTGIYITIPLAEFLTAFAAALLLKRRGIKGVFGRMNEKRCAVTVKRIVYGKNK